MSASGLFLIVTNNLKVNIMQIISQSENVILMSAKDSAGTAVFTVVYGLQIEKFYSFREALNEYTECLMHSYECGDI